MRTLSNYCFWSISFFLLIPVFIMQTQCEKYKLKLSANYTLVWHVVENEYINFAALVQTTGWIGLGINRVPSMDKADLIVTGVGSDTRPYLHAYHGFQHKLIQEEVPHWEIDYGRFFESPNSTVTIINILRPLEPSDKDSLYIEDKEMYLLWSYGSNDDTRMKHTERGAVRLNFLNPSSNITVIF